MDILKSLRSLQLVQGSIIYIQDEAVANGDPHYWLILNKSDGDEETLHIVCSSNILEAERWCKGKDPLEGEALIVVEPSEETGFTLDTVINCYRIRKVKRQEILEKGFKFKGILPDYYLKRTIETIQRIDSLSEADLKKIV